MRRPVRPRFEHREVGSATIFVVCFAVILLALAGLVIDGGLAINARQRIADDVEQAARAGSQDLNMDRLRADGVVEIDPIQAEEDARAFLAVRNYDPDHIDVTVAFNQVTVEAQTEQKTTLLSLIGVGDFTVRAQAQARPSVGIDNGGAP